MMNKKGLYIHIPFCHKICAYCDFCKRVSNKSLQAKYIDYLIKEIDLKRIDPTQFDTIYIGGGTPSSLEFVVLEKLLKKIQSLNINFKEYTIEVNPEDLSIPFIDLITKFKINRVSIGIQTISHKLNLIINRHFNFERFNEAYWYLKKKIPNINIDLMYAIPNQTIEDLKESIDYVLSLEPTHLSVYSLIIEEKTIIKKQIDEGKLKVISEDLELEMIDLINKLIFPKYTKYEVSNYYLSTDEKYQSFHNLKYWLNQEYLGLGLNASSYLNNRFKNTHNLNKYFALIDQNKLPIDEDSIEIIDEKETKTYELIMGLRLVKGLDLTQYFLKFKSDISVDFPNLEKMLHQHFVQIEDHHLFINPKYFYVMNTILSELI